MCFSCVHALFVFDQSIKIGNNGQEMNVFSLDVLTADKESAVLCVFPEGGC